MCPVLQWEGPKELNQAIRGREITDPMPKL